MVCRRLLLCSLCLLVTSVASAGQSPAPADGWVVLPVDDYRALRAKAFPVDPAPPPPPVDAAVTRIDYDLAVRDDAVTGTASLVVDVFKDGWVRIGIPTGMLVGDARVDGRPVSVIDQPSPHVLLSTRGRSTLTLQVVLPLKAMGAAESVVIPPVQAATTAVTLSMARVGVDVSVANAWLASTSEAGGTTRWVAHARGDQPVSLTWRRRVDDRRAGQTLKIRGGVTHLVGLGEELTQVTASVRVDVVSGLMSDVVIAIPGTLQVSRVMGPAVADWEASPGVLRVKMLDPVSGTTSFSVVGEVRGAAQGTVEVPLVRLRDADRESGGVAVEVLGAGEITERRPEGLEPADPLDLGEAVTGRESPSMVAYRFAPIAGTAPRALSVQVVRYQSQAVMIANVDEARYQVLATEDGKCLVRARYAVRNNRRSLLSVALPAGATLWSTSVSRRVIRPGRSPEGALLVPLERGQSGDDLPPFVVEVAYVVRNAAFGDRGTLSLPLPAIDLPISRTGVAVYHSPRYRLAAVTGSFRFEPFSDPVSAVLRENGSAPPAPPAAPRVNEPAAAQESFKSRSLESRPGILPLDIAFPEVGEVAYLVAELTPETQIATLGLQYERERGT